MKCLICPREDFHAHPMGINYCARCGKIIPPKNEPWAINADALCVCTRTIGGTVGLDGSTRRDWETDGPALERRLAQTGVELEALAKKWDKMEPRGGKNGGLKRIVRAEAKQECAAELRALAQQQGAK